MKQKKSELVQKYVLMAWIMKIRLMSSRRLLWEKECSVIHVETASLQLRKVCECLARLCIILAEIEFEDIPKQSRKDYEPGKIFKFLSRRKMLNFPKKARLNIKHALKDKKIWELNISDVTHDDAIRISKIWSQLGRVMHEFFPYPEFSTKEEAFYSVSYLSNSIKKDHQWIWNRFWQHAIYIHGKLFFVDLADTNSYTKPMIVTEEGLSETVRDIGFDPMHFSDFDGDINWGDFSQ